MKFCYILLLIIYGCNVNGITKFITKLYKGRLLYETVGKEASEGDKTRRIYL